MRTDRWKTRWSVESYTDPGKKYTVALDFNGKYGCTCPHYKFRHVDCKHIKAVLAGQGKKTKVAGIATEDMELMTQFRIVVLEDNSESGITRVAFTRDFGDRE